MMLDKSSHEFIEELSSKKAVPGGGGASAYVGALGMALGSMVGNLTVGKKKYREVESEIEETLRQSTKLIERLEDLIEADAQAFLPLSKAYGMPQTTEEERQEKEVVLQAALINAAQVPLDIAKACLEAIDLLDVYAQKGSRLAISDAGVGATFCKSALEAAQLNVLINTKLMKDVQIKQQIESELSTIVEEGTRKADEIYQYVLNELKQ